MKLILLLIGCPLHLIDFLRDSKKYLKDHKRETEHYPIKHIKKSTVYPDNAASNFNEWSKYVCDQSFNNYRN